MLAAVGVGRQRIYAYKAAGGIIIRDLFDDDEGGYLQDVPLLERLVSEKLAAVAEAIKAEGWGWVEAAVDFPWNHHRDFRTLKPISPALTEDQDNDEDRAAVAGMHGFLGEHAADGVRPLVPLLLDGVEDLLLPLVVVGQAKRHELIEGDFVILISLKQNGARLGETQALFHHMRADAESSGNGFLALAFVGVGLEGAKLVERMQRFAFGVLGETVGFDKTFRAYDAGDGRVFCQPPLLDEKLQGAKAATASLYAVGLKTNIRDTGDALGWLGNMRIRDFTVKSTGEARTGVVAQEMQPLHPDMVHKGPDGLYKVEQPNPWRIIKAIQELKALFGADHDEIAKLKAVNDNQAAELKALKGVTDRQSAGIEALKAENAKLKAANDNFAARLEKLEKASGAR